jgi:TldD protein
VQIFNSEGIVAEDERRQLVFAVRAIATDGNELQTAARSIGGRVGFEFLTAADPVTLASRVGESAVKMLRARHAPAGTMEVVLSSEAGGTMIHEAIGHGLEGDTAEKGLSVYSGKVGEMIASPHVTVVDDATIIGKRGSFAFDDEGVPAQRTVLVEGGVLKGYLLNRQTAKKLGTVSTGNGRRASYRYRPLVRMSNTMIEPGEHEPAGIIARVRRGLYVVRMGGGQVDTSSGDFVFKVNEAYLIENGTVTEPVRGATLIGNGPGILREIDMVGNDLGFEIGSCGKDGQYVPVADAQPTLRLPAITVGGVV